MSDSEPGPQDDFNEVKRRNDAARMTPAEVAISEAMTEVQQAGDHPALADAVGLLAFARDKVSDYVDGVA